VPALPLTADIAAACAAPCLAQPNPTPGGSLNLAKVLADKGFTSGVLRCPRNDVVCPSIGCPTPCNNAQCYKGRCICRMEYTGPNCSTSLVPGLTL
jgi:hypothetical protein